MFWDFLTLRQESAHQVSFLFSDRGTPDGYRHMNGYGSHTFKIVNAEGNPIYCKFHYKVGGCGFVLGWDDVLRLPWAWLGLVLGIWYGMEIAGSDL